jgi:ADP-heptose:LPS heptosyltransferase
VLAVRLDSAGDVLLMGPALRALAQGGHRVDLLVSPRGAEAAALLPAVAGVIEFDAPWAGLPPARFDADVLTRLVDRLARERYDEAVVFTSYHQSPLPMAVVARLAGVPRVCATSDDHPGSLLDVRHRRRADGRDDDGTERGGHEVVAALGLAAAAGHRLPPGDDGRLRLREPLPAPPAGLPDEPYVVLHPGAAASARGISTPQARRIAAALAEDGWSVVVTGGAGEAEAAREVTPTGGVDLGGRTSLGELASVLRGAAAVVVGNTGPAHLAAAVGTPVVSLFAPVVPAARWEPWKVPCVLLGDQHAPCAGTRARECPVAGHPCVSRVDAGEVVAAVRSLTEARRWPGRRAS